MWLSGLEAVKNKIGVKAVYDLSATPFFLQGSGYPEGTLFPWVVSDFSLIDAIEAGHREDPRVPVADNSMTGDQPTYRDLWLRIRDDLPKKGRKTDAVGGEPKLPAELQGALHSLYGNYEKSFERWQTKPGGAGPRSDTARVHRRVQQHQRVEDGLRLRRRLGPRPWPTAPRSSCPARSRSSATRRAAGRPPAEHDPRRFRAARIGRGDERRLQEDRRREIEEFKAEYRARFPGRDTDDLTDEDLLREVMNTVGKAGKLGEQVRCVVSVSMLTEGWDANTVTHILGVRAFGTQLLCEQVVGRGLRRMSYAVNDEGHFDPEYAEVYGVPFSFIPGSGSTPNPSPGPMPTRVRALEDRIACEITFPRLLGYRYDVPSERLSATFTGDSKLALSTADIPTRTENAPIVGERSIHTLDDLKRHRDNEVAFLLAKLTLEKYFRQDNEQKTDRPSVHRFDADVKGWLFPQVLAIAKRWLAECVTCKDNTFPQLLLLIEFAHDAADRIYKAIVESAAGTPALKPILRPYDVIGSTRYVDFDTTKAVYPTAPDKCHISHVVADTGSWEQKMAQALEEMPEVVRYVKNQSLGFTIPYTLNGEEKQYYPDFIAQMHQFGKDLGSVRPSQRTF